jgi:hypothetical protein
MMVTIDFFDVLVLGLMGVAALCLAPLVLGVLLFTAFEPKRKPKPPRQDPRALERKELLASLPRTKAGDLFPYGKRLLAKFDEESRR